MAIDLTAVATAGEYRDRTGKQSTAADTTIGALLTTMTRVVERRIGVAPGMLKPQTGLTFTFSAQGGSRLHLRDDRGSQYLLRSITADSLKIDASRDGTFDDYLLDTADLWVTPIPVNAAALEQPYTAIDLRPLASATITQWPDAEASVQITGTWGWAATPGALKERVIAMTRELIETHAAGPTLTIANLDESVQINPTTRSLMAMLEREFRYRIPAVA